MNGGWAAYTRETKTARSGVYDDNELLLTIWKSAVCARIDDNFAKAVSKSLIAVKEQYA